MKKQIIILLLLLTGYGYSQPIYTGVNRDTVIAIINEQSQGIKKIYGIIENGSVTTWNVFGFNSDATNVISGDTLIVTDANGELDLEGIVLSNNYDFTIVGTPTVYQLKVEWGGFTGKTISFIWQTDTISTAFVEYSGTSNTYNYNFDTTAFRTFSNLKYLENADSANQRTFSDLKYSTKVITNSLAEDIANIADSNFVLTSETSAWDKNASDDALFYTGTDSIHYGKDSIVVAHGVGSTPSFVSIQLVSDGFGFQTWVSGINSLTFYVRRSDTGLKTINSSIQFKWMAKK